MKRYEDEYEIETRFLVPANDRDSLLSMLSANQPVKNIAWKTVFFGSELFRSGQLLRITEIRDSDLSLCMKTEDIGSICNIRREISEVIKPSQRVTDLFDDYFDGFVLNTWESLCDIKNIAGHERFMEFSGENWFGSLQQGLDYKLMQVGDDAWPLIVEIEATAVNAEQAIRSEELVLSVSNSLGLKGEAIKIEPPSILYNQLFQSGQPKRIVLQNRNLMF